MDAPERTIERDEVVVDTGLAETSLALYDALLELE
jgi:hypothetical protein